MSGLLTASRQVVAKILPISMRRDRPPVAFEKICAIKFRFDYKNGVVGQLLKMLSGMAHCPLSSFLLPSGLNFLVN